MKTTDILKRNYTRVFVLQGAPGNTTERVSAQILEFSGCFADGETINEAVKALETAAISWIESALIRGQAIPEPYGNCARFKCIMIDN